MFLLVRIKRFPSRDMDELNAFWLGVAIGVVNIIAWGILLILDEFFKEDN